MRAAVALEPGRARRTARDRMDVADLGNHRRSENGAPHPGDADRRGFARRAAGGGAELGDVLRYPALRRAADISARCRRARIADATRRRRIGRRFPDSRRRRRSDAYFGHAVALAARSDEPRGAAHRPGLRQAVRRDRRRGASSTRCRRSIRGRGSPMPTPRRKRASASRSTMDKRDFRSRISADATTGSP